MKIATWNVNSINARMEHLLAWLKRASPDVVCLQETKCIDENFPLEPIESAGYEAAFMGQKSYNGVAILSRHKISEVQKNFPGDQDDAPKRFLAATIKGIRVVNTYIPNGTELWTDKFTFKLDWLQRLRKFFDSECDTKSDVLLCGDFNVAPDERDVWDPKLWEGKLHFTKPERAALDHVKKWGFVDVFRKLHGDEKLYSWWDYRQGAFPKNHGLRIDHIWTSAPLAEKCKECEIDISTRKLEKPSDHAPVIAEFKIK